MDGVILTPLKRIYNPDGDVCHAIKKSDTGYSDFGEAYFSCIKHDVIKGWKKHTKMTLNLIVPIGSIKFVIYDNRPGSKSEGEFISMILSVDNYQRLTIAPGLWVGFKGLNLSQNMLLNIASIEHDPAESENVSLGTFNYDWS